MSASVLLADDDTSLRLVLQRALGKEGYTVRATNNAATLAKWARDGEGDVVLSDVYMGDTCIFDVLPGMRAARPQLPVIVISAHSTIATALSAAGAGVFDYLPKPFDLDQLIAVVGAALAGDTDVKARLAAARAGKDGESALIGRSAAMQEVFRVVARVAATDLPVLIEGESGAGKRRVARVVHDNSRRAHAPFVSANFAAATPADVDRELCGPAGKMAQARGGTLLLEDIDGLGHDAQMRLSGLLHSDDSVDVRLIAASQRNLETLVRENAFRRDLFYRLGVVTVRLPPLRERREDIGELARAFLLRAQREGLPLKMIENAAIERLMGHAFPGNVRELENILRRAAALCPSPLITAHDIEQQLGDPRSTGVAGPVDAFRLRVSEEFARASPGLPDEGLYMRLQAEFDRSIIEQALEATGGNQIRAAAVLGLNRNTLRKRIQTLGLRTGKAD